MSGVTTLRHPVAFENVSGGRGCPCPFRSVPVGFLVSRRLSGALACALAVSLLAAACSGGDDPKAGPSASASAGASSSPQPSYGEPAYPDADAAFAAMSDYNVRNNAVLPKAMRPPFDPDVFAAVDEGPAMARNRWDVALAKADPASRDVKPWTFEKPTHVYLPASTSWPKLVLAAADTKVRGQKAKPSKWIPLSVLTQPAAGAPLKHVAWVWVLRAKLPAALDPDADPSVSDRGHAVALAHALAAHWTKDTDTVAGFTSTDILDADLDQDRSQRSGPNAITWTARMLGGADGVRTVAVEGGTLVVADFRVVKTIRALGVGGLVYWSGDYAKVLGSAKRSSVTADSYLGAAWFMPTGGGPAVPLGATRVPALF